MKPARLIGLVISSWIVASGAMGFWAVRAWGASDSMSSYAVKGASTDDSTLAQAAPTPTLAPYVSMTTNADPDIQAKEYALYNPESGRFLVASPDMSPVPIASTTKLMTTYLTTKYGNLDDVVTVSQEGGTQIPSVMGLVPGEQITVHNLLLGALLVSGNDAAFTLGEYIGGKLLNNPNASTEAKIARFVTEMNSEAKILYMTNTHYMDPAGLNDEGHSTAKDLARLTWLVDQQPILQQIIATSDITVSDVSGKYSHILHNSNRLLSDQHYDGVLGGKTGYTPDAGHCLITSVRQNGITLIAVVLNTYANTADASADESRKLLNFGFTNLKVL